MKPWPTVADVVEHLHTPLASFTPAEQDQLQLMLDASIDDARRVPEQAGAVELRDRPWLAVVRMAAFEYGLANPGTRGAGGNAGMDFSNPGSVRYALRLDMGWGRGGRARVG